MSNNLTVDCLSEHQLNKIQKIYADDYNLK